VLFFFAENLAYAHTLMYSVPMVSSLLAFHCKWCWAWGTFQSVLRL